MNNSTYFRDWVFNTYKPCGIVYATEKSKNIIKKNNLSPADFLMCRNVSIIFSCFIYFVLRLSKMAMIFSNSASVLNGNVIFPLPVVSHANCTGTPNDDDR